MNSPFPYFGGKRTVAADVWRRLGAPAQYIEPFCGGAAVFFALGVILVRNVPDRVRAPLPA